MRILHPQKRRLICLIFVFEISVPYRLGEIGKSDMFAADSNSSNIKRVLSNEYRQLCENPIEGIQITTMNTMQMRWEVIMFGPPGTLYQGAYLKLSILFPNNYPYADPCVQLHNQMWHPNITTDGIVCIDAPAYEAGRQECLCHLIRSARNHLLAVVSLLNEPVNMNPVNPEAAEMYMRWIMNGDLEYVNTVRSYVQITIDMAQAEGVIVPTTIEEYSKNAKKRRLYELDYLDEESLRKQAIKEEMHKITEEVKQMVMK